MCDLAYVNLLREKVRQLKTEEKRVAVYGTTLHERFVPWTIPAPSQSHESGVAGTFATRTVAFSSVIAAVDR